MKTDKFDEEFRRKVENFHPPFNDTEIDRIQGYVGQHIPLSFWQRFGHVFTYSVGAFIIVSLLTTTVYKTYENKSLLKQISVLNTQLEQTKADSLAMIAVPKEIIIEKTDTVFVTKYVAVSASNSEESLFAKNDKKVSDYKLSKSINEIEDETRIISKETDNKLVTKTFDAKITEKIVLESNETDLPDVISENKRNNKIIKKENKLLTKAKSKSLNNTNTKKQNTEPNITILANLSSPEIPISTPNSIAEKAENRIFNYDYLSHKNYHSDEIKAVFDLSNRNFSVPKLLTKTTEKKAFKLPNINLPTLKYRVGFGVEMANEHGGFNVLTDVLVSKRWSVTTGVGFSTFFDDKDFDDEDEFKRNTKKDFRKEYESRINDNSQINDIHINQALVKIPFYINYRLPLPNNFTVLFTAGTNFDIYNRQFVSYNHQNSFRDDDHNRFSIKGNIRPFNNLLFSTGIEKRWKKYSVQLNPYFSTQLKPVIYQNEDWQIGLKLNGFYRISR